MNEVVKSAGVCEKVGNTFRCRCQGRMKGVRCELRDFCDSAPCQHGSRCSNGITGPICDCPSGYTGLDSICCFSCFFSVLNICRPSSVYLSVAYHVPSQCIMVTQQIAADRAGHQGCLHRSFLTLTSCI